MPLYDPVAFGDQPTLLNSIPYSAHLMVSSEQVPFMTMYHLCVIITMSDFISFSDKRRLSLNLKKIILAITITTWTQN